MQSQNPNERTPSSEFAEGVPAEYQALPNADAPLQAQPETQSTTGRGGEDFSFIDHLSSREIYRMPTEDFSPVGTSYVPRFSDTVIASAEVGSSTTVEESQPTAQETAQPITQTEAPKGKTIRIITPVDHSTIRASDDRIVTTTSYFRGRSGYGR